MAESPTLVRSRGDEQLPLRLPPGFRDALKEAAALNGRSMNAEILHRLLAYGNDDRLARVEAKLDLILSKAGGDAPALVAEAA